MDVTSGHMQTNALLKLERAKSHPKELKFFLDCLSSCIETPGSEGIGGIGGDGRTTKKSSI